MEGLVSYTTENPQFILTAEQVTVRNAGDCWMALELEKEMIVVAIVGDDLQGKVVDGSSVNSEESVLHAPC